MPRHRRRKSSLPESHRFDATGPWRHGSSGAGCSCSAPRRSSIIRATCTTSCTSAFGTTLSPPMDPRRCASRSTTARSRRRSAGSSSSVSRNRPDRRLRVGRWSPGAGPSRSSRTWDRSSSPAIRASPRWSVPSCFAPPPPVPRPSKASLRRYRRLLLHARDASDSGRALDRASLRRFTLDADDQLLLWALLPAEQCGSELRTGRPPRAGGEHCAGPRIGRTPRRQGGASGSSLLSGGCRSLVFVSARETVTYLRHSLAGRSVAWCTGARSGIARATLPRDTVLAWFRPGAPHGPSAPTGQPDVLIATDVAAEGLDLQAAGRIIHYDLPWTDVRREQRNGRVVRRGSIHSSIEVLQISPGQDLEARLRQLERLAAKRGSSATARTRSGGSDCVAMAGGAGISPDRGRHRGGRGSRVGDGGGTGRNCAGGSGGPRGFNGFLARAWGLDGRSGGGGGTDRGGSPC